MTPASSTSSRRFSLLRGLILSGTGLALIVALFLAADWFTRRTVTLTIGGEVRHYHTHAHTVQEVLDEAHAVIDPEDVIQPNPSAPVKNGMRITVHKAEAVALQADGRVRQVRTQAANPLTVLDEQSIRVSPYDRIQVNGQDYSPERLQAMSWNAPVTSICVVRSVTITVIDGGEPLTVHTTQADVGRALDDAGIRMVLADRVIPDFGTPITEGMVIRIERSVPFTLIADRQQLTTRALGPTVGDALAQIGIAPLGLDYTVPPLESRLEPGMTIRLVRVSEGTAAP